MLGCAFFVNINHMKIFDKLIVFLVGTCVVIACGDDKNDFQLNGGNTNANHGENATAKRLEFPKLKGGNNMVIVHSTKTHGINFAVEWDCVKRSQRWSCYQMYASNSGGNVGRYDDGYPYDPQLPDEYYFDNDPFWRSGYDHGHIVPSADRQSTREVNMQTFYLTNMQPQKKNFNAGLWAVMEQQVRNWNKTSYRDTLYVCKGGTIDKSEQILTTLGNGLIVPKYFFMAILCKNSQGYKALGFWVEHKNEDRSDDPLSQYVVNIDELEAKTGIDFFCNLPDEIENQVESLPVKNVIKAWGVR